MERLRKVFTNFQYKYPVCRVMGMQWHKLCLRQQKIDFFSESRRAGHQAVIGTEFILLVQIPLQYHVYAILNGGVFANQETTISAWYSQAPQGKI